MNLYETIGHSYSITRKPDPRIVRKICDFLDLPVGSVIADIGAGTGNYSWELQQLGYRVIAVEPSAVMRAQARPSPRVTWVDARAECLSLENGSVDGSMFILSYHHFSDPKAAVLEALRISGKGPLLLFTMSPEHLPDFWLCGYFPSLIPEATQAFPTSQKVVEDLASWSQRRVTAMPFPLPKDLTDRFAASGWARPEIYLDAAVRQGISSFARMPREAMQAGLDRLKADLESGQWHSIHGDILDRTDYDIGYRFLKIEAEPALPANDLHAHASRGHDSCFRRNRS